MSEENKEAATPVDAATIVLMRDSPEGLEIFMVVRHHQIDFASGALVFPGGKVDPQDADERIVGRMATYSPATPVQVRLQAAAIREAFEESGILLARRNSGASMGASDELETWRAGLNADTLKLADMLEAGDLQLATDDMVHFAHWITPPMMPKRFDTHFYLARVPHDQIAGHDGHENVDSVWIRPQQAIEEAKAGSRTIIFPTMCNVVRLAQYDTVEAAFADARATPVVPITPWTEKREGGNFLCIPKDAGYTLNEQKLPDRRK
jgi:8-oxo-dGTP pyrophosphatase MutT (NUDIX family)